MPEAPSTVLAATRCGILSTRDVSETARADDSVSSCLIVDEAHRMDQGVTALPHAYSSSAVILGDDVAQALDLPNAGIMAKIRTLALPDWQDVIVIHAALGENSGLIGAAALADEACDVTPPLGG